MLVSIIIPCFNCSATIDRAVNSVLSQTHQHWELILVNNNSSDDTWDKIIDIKNKNADKPITILDEKKKGAPAARNKGLYEAKGEWIQFLDADDELLPSKIEKQVKIKKADLIIGGSVSFGGLKNENVRAVQTDPWMGLIMSELGITSANLFRRQNVLDVKGFTESLTSSQEYDLMFKLLENNAVVSFLMDQDTIIYEDNDSISRDKSSKRILQIVKNRLNLRLSIIYHLKRNGVLNPEYKSAFRESVMNNLLYYGNIIPFYSWKFFLKNIHLINPQLKDFKHLLAITFLSKQ